MLLPHEVDLKHCLKTRLIQLLCKEEIKWYQISKSNKLLHGDSNTKYFHLVVNRKHRKTRIFQFEGGCRSGFTTLSPALLWEQPTVVLLLERVYVSRMLAIWKHGGDKRFTLFGPPERNTLRPWENGSCITVCCSNVGLALGCPGFRLSILTFATAFYSTRPQRLHCDLGPDRWPQGGYHSDTLARSR
jgi:hypothetical protein